MDYLKIEAAAWKLLRPIAEAEGYNLTKAKEWVTYYLFGPAHGFVISVSKYGVELDFVEATGPSAMSTCPLPWGFEKSLVGPEPPIPATQGLSPDETARVMAEWLNARSARLARREELSSRTPMLKSDAWLIERLEALAAGLAGPGINVLRGDRVWITEYRLTLRKLAPDACEFYRGKLSGAGVAGGASAQ